MRDDFSSLNDVSARSRLSDVFGAGVFLRPVGGPGRSAGVRHRAPVPGRLEHHRHRLPHVLPVQPRQARLHR